MLMVSHHRLFRIYGYGFPDDGGACIVCCLCTIVRNVYGMFNEVFHFESCSFASDAFPSRRRWLTASIAGELNVGVGIVS